MPEYLTWPLWADHDVFASAAYAWERGLAPYRDVPGNNFPGTIYIFWILGRLFGFGWPLGPAFHAFDAALVAVFTIALVAWSRRMMGSRLPGVIAAAAFLSYYLNLDYGLVAQRDWQGPAFAILGLIAAQTTAGRSGRLASCLGFVVGVTIRPQVVLLLPAMLWVLMQQGEAGKRSVARLVTRWILLFGLGIILSFSPIFLRGLGPDFLRSLGLVGYGNPYNQVSPATFVEEFLKQFGPARLLLVPVAMSLLVMGDRDGGRRLAMPWLIAFLGVSIYAPLSPHAHAYLAHPLILVWCVLLAILAHRVAIADTIPSSMRLAMILVVCGIGLTLPPRLPTIATSVQAVSSLKKRCEPRREPTGYRPTPGHGILGQYPWVDYRDVLVYLRRETAATTRVANGLMLLPAVVGPAGRLSAFPGESVAWLKVVRPEDEERFARSLRDADDSVVVWAPKEAGAGHFSKLVATYHERYEFRKAFGAIEVWVRKERFSAQARATASGSRDSGRERSPSVSIHGSKAPVRSD